MSPTTVYLTLPSPPSQWVEFRIHNEPEATTAQLLGRRADSDKWEVIEEKPKAPHAEVRCCTPKTEILVDWDRIPTNRTPH